jgi:tetratricopeptide (TPR) repeat protein
MTRDITVSRARRTVRVGNGRANAIWYTANESMRKLRRNLLGSLGFRPTFVMLAIACCLLPRPLLAAETYPAETRLARQGVNALLNVELDRSTAIFDKLEKEYPNYPLSGFLHGAVYWVRAEIAQKKQRKAARALAVKHLEAAIARAEKGLKEHPGDPYWRLDLGMSLFFAARIYADQGAIFTTYRYARRGRDMLRELLQTHPHMEDAYFVLGMYEYIAGSVPRSLKWLTRIFDISGDRNLGIRYLERAVAKAPLMAPEAARILLAAAAIQPEHARPCKYRPLAAYTYVRFPDNPYFSMALQLIDVHCGYPEQAMALNRVSIERYLKRYPNLRDTLELVRLQAYRSLGDLKNVDAMKPEFIKSDPAYWYLARAQTLDLLGRRQEAMKIYHDLKWASLYPDDYPELKKVPDWVLDQVEIFSKTPFQRPRRVVVAEKDPLSLNGVSEAETRAAVAKFDAH